MIQDGLSLGNIADIILFAGISTLVISIGGFLGSYFQQRKFLVFVSPLFFTLY
jgi:hypothetical protein